MGDCISFPGRWRRMSIIERRGYLEGHCPELFGQLLAGGDLQHLLNLSDIMIENGIGFFALPLGIASGFIINGKERALPMATEEPSVIAAASFGARLVQAGGGFTAKSKEPHTEGAVYLEGVGDSGLEGILSLSIEVLRARHREVHPGIYGRGGGLISFTARRLPSGIVRVGLVLDVCDAMGANIVNTACEALAPDLASAGNGRVVMAILTNSCPERIAEAGCRIPLRKLARGGYSGLQMGERIEMACRIAAEDPTRAVTHNKGIMNGVTALCMATGNDSRGLEAAVHSFAASGEGYRPLSNFRVEQDELVGNLRLPVPLGIVGGAVSSHPVAAFSLGLCNCGTARELGELAAALGLAQNLAALAALTGEGIQQGHMRLHASRIAMQAGAVGGEVERVATRIAAGKTVSLEAAEEALAEIRKLED